MADEQMEAERDDDVAAALTARICVFLRERKLKGSVTWDGCDLLVCWAAVDGDDA